MCVCVNSFMIIYIYIYIYKCYGNSLLDSELDNQLAS